MSAEQINAQINALDRQYQARRDELVRKYEQALCAEAIAAAARERDEQAVTRVMDRLRSGWWVAGRNRLWWHNEGECLVEPVSQADHAALDHLTRQDVVECNYRRAVE
ncbi:MAG: hypothetical protein ACOC00_05720 [Halothiobacillaceae bacterium]